MRKLKLNAIAALFAAAVLAACGGGGGGEQGGEAPPPAPAPGPAPVPAPVPVPAPPPADPVAPSNTLSSGAANVVVEGVITFNSDNGNRVSVEDPDSALLTTTLSLTAGTLAVTGNTGATITGDRTGEVIVVGTVEQINATLDGMVFTAPATPQAVTLQIVTQDETTPTPLSDSDQFTINVTLAPVPEFQSFQPAIDVIGQSALDTSSSGPPTNRNLLSPRGAVALNATGRIYVPDAGHDRVIVFPAGSGMGDFATLFLGQAGPTSGGFRIEQGSHPDAADVAIAGGRMAVAEPSAHRISLYSSVPSSSQLPDGLLGQDAFDSTAFQGCFGRTLLSPEGVAITPDGNKVIVADTGNSRVVVYNAFPTTVGSTPPHDIALGQTHPNCILDPAPSRQSMLQPTGVWTDGTRLVVADTGNNRVLVWNTFPVLTGPFPSDAEQPHRVLGQADFDSTQPNRGAANPAANSLKAPTHVASDGVRLAIADTGNHRVLIWTTFPTVDGAPAQVVIGQSNFAKQQPNDSDQVGGPDAVSARVFSNPTGLNFHNGKLYVTDRDNNRVLIFEPQ